MLFEQWPPQASKRVHVDRGVAAARSAGALRCSGLHHEERRQSPQAENRTRADEQAVDLV